jgi:hypothetical protein
MTKTAGNIIVEEIRIGDIHYEYDGPIGIKCQVIEVPIQDQNGNWTWVSKNLKSGKLIHFFVSEQYPQFSPKLYDYNAYDVKEWI